MAYPLVNRPLARVLPLALLLALLAGCARGMATPVSPSPSPVATAASAAATFGPTAILTLPAPPTTAPTAVRAASRTVVASCAPNRENTLGDEYRPDPPERASVGAGYVLSGVVRTLGICQSVPGARVELWLASPQGVYEDSGRATIVADAAGAYRFESHVPVAYAGAQPHIHIRVAAPGFRPLVTLHPYAAGQHRPVFDLVLTPAP